LPPCDARRQALRPCPVKRSLREAEEANLRVSGAELPLSENFLFNGVNHCGVQVITPHSVGFARLASESFFLCRLIFDFLRLFQNLFQDFFLFPRALLFD
jgi:hypothetical protein